MALHALIERYEARDSALHRADAGLKLLAALACIFAVTLTREGDALALALLALATGAVVAAAKLPPLLVLRRSLIAAPFLLVTLPLLFTRPGRDDRDAAAARLVDQRRGRPSRCSRSSASRGSPW